MLIHTVYFWLQDDMTDEGHQDFQEGLRALMKCKEIQEGHWGKPVPSHRDVVDSSFGYSISLMFNTAKDQEVYQDDPEHHAFIKRCEKYWTRVVVYDVETCA